MEIKVVCQCGTKFKFDVEPVDQSMPWALNCPNCGADATALANAAIRLATPPEPAAEPRAFSTAPPPPAVPAAHNLRINRPAAGEPVPPPPVRTFNLTPPPERPKRKSKLKSILVTLVVIGGLCAAGYKWGRRVIALVHVAQAVTAASTNTDTTTSAKEWNLTADNTVILYVKYPNQAEVAKACAAFWKEKLNRNLQVLSSGKETGDPGEFMVAPEHNGYIKVVGTINDWQEPQFEAAAQYVSRKLNTMVFDEKDVDFTGAWIFGVYDNGDDKFHARYDVAVAGGEEKDTTKLVHQEWAEANGYKPGAEKFNLRDADNITKQLGMKYWDDKEIQTNYIILKDPIAAKAAK